MAGQSGHRTHPETTPEPADETTSCPTATVLAAVVAIAIVGAVASTGPAAAAGSTTVALEPANASVAPGENVTLDVVITDAAGGVGAYNLTVAVADPDVASIATVETVGRPGIENVTRDADGSATVIAGLLDTNDTGSVTVAQVVLAGERRGTTSVSIGVAALADEEANSYTVADSQSTTVRVGDATPGADSAATASTTLAANTPLATATPRATDATSGTDATAGTAVALGDEATVATDANPPETPTASTSRTDGTDAEEDTPQTATSATVGTSAVPTTPGTSATPTAPTTPTATSGSGPGLGVTVACGALLVVVVGRLLGRRVR